MEDALGPIWCPMKGIEVKDLGENRLFYTFLQPSGKKKAMDSGPWMFDKNILVMEDFDAGKTIDEYEFNRILIWVRVYKLPLGRMDGVGELIGNRIGEFMGVDGLVNGMAVGKCLRVKARMPITEPLMRGTVVEVDGWKTAIWYPFEYEHCPDFCFICGLIGHLYKECSRKLKKGEEPQFGKWLKWVPPRRASFTDSRRSWSEGGSRRQGSWGSGSSMLGSDGPTWRKQDANSKNSSKCSYGEKEMTGPLKIKDGKEAGHENTMKKQLMFCEEELKGVREEGSTEVGVMDGCQGVGKEGDDNEVDYGKKEEGGGEGNVRGLPLRTCNKILRARILLPLQRALQRQITLEDAITNEEVVVSVFYERLPNFCLFCGVIGHREANCILPEALKQKRYSLCLGVKATSGADERRWHLPATAGQTRRPLHMAAPWRVVLPTASRMEANLATHQLAIVSHVAKEVARLSVQDREPEGDGSGVGEEKNTSLAASSVANKALVEAPAANSIDKTLVPNNDTIKNIDPKPSPDKVCIPYDNSTAASEKGKEEEAQSTLGPAVLEEAGDETKDTNLNPAGSVLDINTTALTQGGMSKPLDARKDTPVGTEQKEESLSTVPSLSEGARIGDNALIRRLRSEAVRGEEGLGLAARTSVLGKRADRAQAEMEEDKESYSFDVIVSNKKYRGFVLRDSNGKVLVAACAQLHNCAEAEEAEASAALLGLLQMENLKVANMIIESDCYAVVKALLSNDQDRSKWCAVLEEAKACTRSFAAWHVLHVRREANRVADALARLARTSGDFFFGEVPPAHVRELVNNDCKLMWSPDL
ncbi:hypothetical protein ACQ4PT_013617 [Festuca glaucescens]